MPFILVTTYLFFAVLLTVYITCYTIIKSNSALTKMFAAMSLFFTIYLFGYLMELNSLTLEQMYFWNQVQYLTLPFFPALWLIVSLLYTNNSATLRPLNIAAIFAIPFVTFVMRLTNDYHNLYYRSYSLHAILGLNVMQLEKGPWYLIHSGYLALVFFLTTYLYLNYARKNAHSTMAQYVLIIIAIALPYLGLTLIVVNAGNIGLDYTALLMPFTLFLLALAIFKYDFLKLKTIARETVFEKSADAMILLNTNNLLIDYNPAASKIFKELKANLIGESIYRILKSYPDFLNIYKSGQIKDLALRNGKSYEVKVTKTEKDALKTFGYLISLTDVTDRNLAREKLVQLATTDELTGLYNRRHFMELASQEFARAERYDELFSLIMIDIDHFKTLNDTFGHSGGDATLREFGLQLKCFFRKTDIAGRLGGEEFAILIPKLNLEDSYALAERFRKEIVQSKFIYENQEISFTISLGVATYSSELESFEQLVKLADQGLYKAKDGGRNCTRIVT
jgi:diguanylate cyclase (GGDEF)-like protein